MRWIRATLTQTDVAQSIASVSGPLTTKKTGVIQFVIYPEDGNNIDVTNGPARIGGADVDRVAAGGVRGIPLLPGIVNGEVGKNVGGSVAPYNFDTLFIMGATGDVFQIGYVIV